MNFIKKLNPILLLFVAIFTTSIFSFTRISSKNSINYFQSITNLLSDFERINLPLEIEINVITLSIVVSLLMTPIVFIYAQFDYKNSNIEKILLDIFKLVLIFNFSFLSILYYLRLFGFSRGTVLLNFILFPVIYFVLLIIFNFVKNKTSIKLGEILQFSLLLLIIIFNLYANQNETQGVSYNSSKNLKIAEVLQPESNIDSCTEWDGSNNFIDCLYDIEVEVVQPNNFLISNAITFNKKIYILYKSGAIKIYENGELLDFLDISNSVYRSDVPEMGLLGLAFHPSQNYFLVTYTNSDTSLVVDRYELESDFLPNLTSVSTIESYPFNSIHHISGSIIWSQFYEGFLLSVGDMASNKNAVLNTNPLNTTSYKGKILLLNSSKKINSLLINGRNEGTVLENIVAYGLRNPWQVIEFDNKLFIPDVGHANYEELNILDLGTNINDSASYPFGWPLFEGPYYSKDINLEFGGDETSSNNSENITDLFIWDDGKSIKVDFYLKENSINPSVFYKHGSYDNKYRAAIIGGDVIRDKSSKYYGKYFFADYLSKEVFMFDYELDELFIIEMPLIFDGFITSLKVNPNIPDSLFITSGSGELISVNLP